MSFSELFHTLVVLSFLLEHLRRNDRDRRESFVAKNMVSDFRH